jgi:LysR family transcriptional regulator (chromosome initiation inhibitor)
LLAQIVIEDGEDIGQITPSQADVDLYWQSWSLSIGWLDDFRTMLQKRAKASLD